MTFKVEGVWCKTKTEFEKLYRSNNYDLAVSYSDIYNRLMKSDPYNEEPSDVIISLYIRKIVKRAIESKLASDIPDLSIVYMFNTLDQESVSGLQEFMTDLFKEEFEMNLVVINRQDFPKQGVLSKFDNVRFIDND
jgi:hypothetical protein